MMDYIWTGMILISVMCSLACQRGAELAAAVVQGAQGGITLAITIAGSLCLWSGVGKLMEHIGLTETLSRLLMPILKRVFPTTRTNMALRQHLSANICANLLGLGNAATPMGIQAARCLAEGNSVASDELCRLIVLNTASIQLIPANVAALRSGLGCETPFDILPAVWITSICAASAGLLCAWLLGKCGVLRDYIVPLLLMSVSLAALYKKEHAYDILLSGAYDGLKMLLSIVPALVMLLTAVTMLRASGAVEIISTFLAPVFRMLGIPPETAILILIRPISGSAALAVGSDLITRYGVDSQIGRTAAVMLGSTETTFYAISVYFGAAGIQKTRYTIPAALIADFVGFFTASLTVRLLF